LFDYYHLEKFLDYFLRGIEFKNEFARLKVRFLFALLLFGVFVQTIYIIDHFLVLRRGYVLLVGDIIGLGGIITALLLLTRNKMFAAGVVLMVSISITIFVDNVIADFFKRGIILSYARVFISTAELMFLSIVSVLFITKKETFIVFGFVSSFILVLHFAAINSNPIAYSVDKLTPYSYLIGMLGMIQTTAGIGFYVLHYVEKIERAHFESEKTIKTQNEQLEATVEKRTKALQESNQSLREFAYVVSHDLKEPLRTVNGFISLARKTLTASNNQNPDVDILLAHAQKGTERMDMLIKDILEFSRLSNAAPSLQVVNPNVVFSNIRERLAQSITETSAKVTIEKLPNMIGEEMLLTQLFQNLVSNAIKYRSADINPEVTIGYSKNEFFVKDNGIGIAQQNHEVIFDAFKRLHKNSSKYEGTGIGLAICIKITEILGGTIRVESEEGKGSTFFIALPIER
jgi:signal transduction histidine kinase